MKKFVIFLFLSFFIFGNLRAVEMPENVDEVFAEWLIEFKKMAKEKYGIRDDILEAAFKDVKYNHRVIGLDRKQPEFVKTFFDYYDSKVTKNTIEEGKKKMKEHEKLLKEVQKKYNVQPQILVALWGAETDYGRNKGRSQIIPNLTTLAFDHRRSKFFTEELIYALKIVQKGDANIENFKGSWSGAFGNFQFMPSTFMKYAIDGDGDGKIDLYNSIPDSIYSAANFLSKIGWKGNYIWGRVVLFNRQNNKIWEQVNSKDAKELSYFAKLGLKTYYGKPLPKSNIKANLIAPMGVSGPVFLVYDNFRYVKRWNNSNNYALLVCLLSDAIATEKPIELKNFK